VLDQQIHRTVDVAGHGGIEQGTVLVVRSAAATTRC